MCSARAPCWPSRSSRRPSSKRWTNAGSRRPDNTAGEMVGGAPQAGLESGEVAEAVGRRGGDPHDLVALLGERFVDHEIVGVAEILDLHEVRIKPGLRGRV